LSIKVNTITYGKFFYRLGHHSATMKTAANKKKPEIPNIISEVFLDLRFVFHLELIQLGTEPATGPFFLRVDRYG
jgi:hypothetical protein